MQLLSMERYSKSGFTFIEIIVTLFVIAILATASIPLVRHLLIENRIKAAAENFAQYARFARSEAISRQQDIYMVFQTGAGWCYGIHTSASCTCSPTNTCSLGSETSTGYTGVSISTSSLSSNNFYFDSIRALPSQSPEITFQVGTKSITVKISRLGQVALCATNISSGYPTC